MKYKDIDLVDSTTIPNDYISYSVKKKRIPRHFVGEKRFDMLDILLAPTALVMAVSLGVLVYQLATGNVSTDVTTGLFSIFGK